MRRQLFILVGLLFSLVLAVSWSGFDRVAEAQPATFLDVDSAPSSAQAEQVLQSSPLMFIGNVGQFADGARFQVRGGDQTIWLAKDAIWITILEPAVAEAKYNPGEYFPLETDSGDFSRQGVNIRLSFVGANPAATIESFAPLETTVSYFTGNDPAGWRPDVPVWGGVRYVDLYPGLDLEMSGSSTMRLRLVCRTMDCDTALANVALQVEGAEELVAGDAGLVISTAIGVFTLPWMEVVDGTGRPVADDRLGSVVLGNLVKRPYRAQPSHSPLTNPNFLDSNPAGSDLLYSTFLGGSNWDIGHGVAINNTGQAIVTGLTSSPDFPTTPGAFDTSSGYGEAFVVKLNPTGSGLLYATFLGSGAEGNGVALDNAGLAIIVGHTSSPDFPITPNAFDTTYNGDGDAFVVKLNGNGSSLLYSTFLGGGDWETGEGIAVDGAGNALITGYTDSTNFPTTPAAFDTTYNGFGDTFMAKLNATGSSLLYSTFLGGDSQDIGYGIAVDGAGNASVTGYTGSTNFPATPGAFDSTYNGDGDAFVVKLNATGSSLLYSTFLGGGDWEIGEGIAVDGAGNAFVTGYTGSTNFPTTPGAFDTTHNGGPVESDAFVTKLKATGSSLLYSTFLGGSYSERSSSVVVDNAGRAIVTGSTNSIDFPVTPGAFDTTFNGNPDVFVARITATGKDLNYATLLGGSNEDGGFAIAVDTVGQVIVSGWTWSNDFPTTPGAFDTTFNSGEYDAFVSKLALNDGGGGCPVPYFSQRDPSWSNHPLRTSGICSAYCSTIGTCGCTLTAATMLFAYYGANITPPELSDCMGTKACPFYWGTGASCSQGRATFVNKYAFSWTLLDQQLNQFNRPVILGMHRNGNTNATHWVLVISGQGSDPAGYTVHDPWPLNGANTSLSVLVRDNYIFDWLSVYSGNATCNLPSIKPSHPQIQSQPVLVVPASVASELEGDQLSVISEVTGAVRLYHRTELTMTVQLTATSPFGEITEMQVWTDANPNPVWQPFSEYGWLEWFPEHDVIYARFRDELGNESGLANDTAHPVYSPPPESAFQQLWLPILLKPQ